MGWDFDGVEGDGIPIYTNVRRHPLVTRRKDHFRHSRTHSRRDSDTALTVVIHNGDVVEPHPRVDIGIGPIEVPQVCLYVGDEAVCAGRSHVEYEGLHAMVIARPWDGELAVRDFQALRLGFFEEARLKGLDSEAIIGRGYRGSLVSLQVDV